MKPSFDPGIPVLTEVLRDADAPAAPPAPSPIPDAPAAERGEHAEPAPLQQWGEQDWQTLEQRLTDRILRQLQGRVDAVLEQGIRDSLAGALQRALQPLTAELSRGLQHTIEQIVADAVRQELAQLQACIK